MPDPSMQLAAAAQMPAPDVFDVDEDGLDDMDETEQASGTCLDLVILGPKKPLHIRVLQTMGSGVPRVLGLRSRM